MTALLLPSAHLPTGTARDVLVEIVDGRFTRVEAGARDAGGAERLTGHALPGFANTHSHAFHRALRGRTQRGRGSFWTWREVMYDVAARLEPETYRDLAGAVYAEMAAAGTTAVGEFHYLHHRGDGTPYPDHAMEVALAEAAHSSGLRLTLLDTLYLAGGFGQPATGAQVRYSDGDVDAWAARVESLAARLAGRATLGLAVHSVRAVPASALPRVAQVLRSTGATLHVHLSEQVAENEASLAAHGRTPTQLLADAGLLGERTTLVHATHLTESDVALIGDARCHVSFCPTTERDLGDGIGPAGALRAAGARLTLGSDSHAVIDPFEEMRGLEMDERLATRARGHFSAAELLHAATAEGQASLGHPDAGRIEVGARADLVLVDDASVRTAGTGGDEAGIVFAASAADVVAVMADGRWVASAADRPGVADQLTRSIGRLWPAADRTRDEDER